MNSTINIPPFANGATNPVVVTATKTNQAQPAQVQLTVTDVGGNTTTCDPVLVTVVRGVGHATTVHDVARAEHVVTVRNASPGLRALVVTVNGTWFRVRARAGQERSLDVASAMHPGTDNTIVLTGRGPRGSTADVVIWDGSPRT